MNLLQRIDSQRDWSQEERLVIAGVEDLCRSRIGPAAERHDREARFPWDNVHAINEMGLNMMFIPDEYGGAPLSYSCYLRCVREISAACASTGIIWATNFHAIKPVIDFGSAQQKASWLPRVAQGGLAALAITEPTAGSDATAMRTTFTPENGAIRVNGQKLFITNGDVADFYLVFGRWKGIADAKASISVAVIEKGTPGLSVTGVEDKMGMRASSTAALAFDDCLIPAGNLLGRPGDGLAILFSSLNKSRPSVAAHALGIARAAFDEGVGYANTRRQSGRRVLEFQGIQFLLADLASELVLCESWLWTLAGLMDAGHGDLGIEASVLKLRSTDLAMRMTTEAVQLFGGYGFCKPTRVERLMRDAKITQIWEGTNQVHRQLIGRSFLERSA